MSDAVAALTLAAPAVGFATTGPVGIGSSAWNEAYVELGDACVDAGSELGVIGFVGG